MAGGQDATKKHLSVITVGCMEPVSQIHIPAKKLWFPPVPERRISDHVSLTWRHHVRTFEFAKIPQGSPEWAILETIVDELGEWMRKGNELHWTLPPDTRETLIPMLTVPGCFTTILYEEAEDGTGIFPVGFTAMTVDKQHIHDFEKIPAEWQEEKIARLFRFYVSDKARKIGDDRPAYVMLMENALENAVNAGCEAVVCKNIIPTPENPGHPWWLKAGAALQKWFQPSDHLEVDEFHPSPGTVVRTPMAWCRWPGTSDDWKELHDDYVAKYADRDKAWECSIAPVCALLTQQEQHVLVIGPHGKDHLHLAAKFPGNHFFTPIDRETQGVEPLTNVNGVDLASHEGQFDQIFACDISLDEAMALVPWLKEDGFFHYRIQAEALSPEDTKARFEAEGLRVLSCAARDLSDSARESASRRVLDLAAEKVPEGGVVKIKEISSREIDDSSIIGIVQYPHENGSFREAFVYAGQVRTIAPVMEYLDHEGEQVVAVRVGPWPVAGGMNVSSPLDGSLAVPWGNGGILRVDYDPKADDMGNLAYKVANTLEERTGIPIEDIKDEEIKLDRINVRVPRGRDFGGVVVSIPVSISVPVEVKTHTSYLNLISQCTTNFVRQNDFTKVCETTGMSEPELENDVAALCIERGHDPGEWLGDRIPLRIQRTDGITVDSAEEVLNPQIYRPFGAPVSGPAKVYRRMEGIFAEYNSKGKIINTIPLQYVLKKEPEDPLTPRHSTNAVSVLPVMRARDADGNERIYAGIEMIESPVAQQYFGTAWLASVPTFDLPEFPQASGQERELAAMAFASSELESKHNLVLLDVLKAVGPAYFPLRRIDPTNILPCIAEVSAESLKKSGLKIVPLDDLLEHLKNIKCGNLRLSVKRASHAWGLLHELCARRRAEIRGKQA